MNQLKTLTHRLNKVSKKLLYGGIGVIILLIIISKLFHTSKEMQKPSEDFRVYAHVSKATNEIITLRTSGASKASKKINLLSETSGQIYRIHHKKGHVLNINETLATIQLEDRSQSLKQVRAAYELAKHNLNIINQLAKDNFRSDINLKTAQVEYETAATNLAKMEREIKNTMIEAPFKGVLGDVFLEEGSVVAPGTTVATLLNLDPILIQIYVSEKDYSTIALNSLVQISLANDTQITGKISFISSIADPKTHMFLVEASAENPDFKIPEGATAHISIPTIEQKVHKISPSVLSIDQNGNMAVKVLTADDKVESYPVKLVQSVGDSIWVTGLPDDTIIIDYGSNFVNVGEKVQWKPTEELKGSEHVQ
jgi:membrane fusion protein, multidrug efflux system